MNSRTRGLTVFLVISFGGSWAWMLIAHFAFGLSAINPILQLPGAVLPALAAVVVRSWVTKEGYHDAGLALRLRTAWPQYLAAGLGPLAIAATTVGLAALLGLWQLDLSPLDNVVTGVPGWAIVPILVLIVVPVLTPIYWGEEFGWTSYLRPRLCGGRLMPSLLLTGLIWGVWHFPLAFIGYVEFANVPQGLAIWTISFLPQELLLAWLFIRSGSIWTASLAHAGNNMVLSLLVGSLLSTNPEIDVTDVTLLTMVPTVALCAWLLVTGGFSTTTRRSSKPGMTDTSPSLRSGERLDVTGG